ncbi:discoidin domain-containing protein [Pelomonas sp. V22]|uniref:Ig-like domain-containing protein n=1 Tax=Pelomonas sp. V22 TaxID=2822139 RepID=UPI0024A9688A|nr:Ig-like domain-containing protein [Pelomonas sp. V22]MDI4631696.1 discoidin domain-containing protein [Pelomonas sp. V22]
MSLRITPSPLLALALLTAALLSSCGGGNGEDSKTSTAQGNQRRIAAAGGTGTPVAPVLNGNWTQLPNPKYAPPVGPYARVWTEMLWDPLLHEMVIFGGNGATGYENDIWSYNASTTNWTVIDPQVNCPGNYGFDKPNGTDDTNFKYDPVNRLYWIFGVASGYRCPPYATTRTAATGTTATQVVDPSLTPPASGSYVQWHLRSGGFDVLVSGYDDNAKTLTLASPITGLNPGSSYQLYATAGAGIWYFDPATKTWVGQDTPPGNTGITPTGARIAPAVAYSDASEAFVLFGGKSLGSDKSVWRLDVRTKLWTQLPVPSGGTPPHMREMLNSLVYDKANDVFVLFGGVCSYDGVCPEYSKPGQTWVYHLPSNTWTNMNPPVAPSPRAQQVMSYDEEHGVIVLFGGAEAGTGEGVGASDTWYYHVASNTWTQVSTPTTPPGRYLSQITYDADLKRTVIFGGRATGMLGDIWALKLVKAVGAPTVALTSPTAGSSYFAPASINISADASDVGGSISKVEFFAGATKIGEASSAPYALSWNNVAIGSYAITAVATDNTGMTATSAAVNISVIPVPNAPPTVSLGAPISGDVFTAPASITLTANASDSDGTVSKVEFYAGSTKLGEATSAPWSYNWSGVSAGNYSLKAVATDNGGASTTSSTVSIVVNPSVNQPPVVSLTAPTGGSSYTSPAAITLTASASDADGSVAKVEFFAGATKLGEKTSAPFSYAWTGVAAGSYALSARATDNSGATTTSSTVNVTVSDPVGSGPSVNVALQSNGGVASASSVYSTAYPVSAINDGNRRGNNWGNGGGWNDASASSWTDWAQINFSGSKTINRIVVYTLADNYASAPEATASTTFTQYGLTDFQVQYWNGSSWVTVPGGSVTGNNYVMRGFTFPAVTTDRIRVLVSSSLYWYSRIVELEAWTSGDAGPNTPPAVALTSPLPGANFTAPASITLQATATDSDGSVAKVEFFNGATKIGESTTAPFSYAWTGVTPGGYVLTAVATDNAGATTTSSAVAIVVNAPNVAPTVSLSSPTTGSLFSAPATVSVSANAADSDGSIVKVEFYAGATKIGESTSAPYGLNWSGMAAGSYVLTARATDNSGAATTSAGVSVTINLAPTVSLTSPTGGSSYTAPASITLSATAADSDGSIAKVEFYAGASKIGEATAAPYSFAWTSVPAGSYVLTARAIDNRGASTTSTTSSITVNAPNVAPSVSLTAPAGGSLYTAPASVTLTANASDSDGIVSKVEFFAGATKIGESLSAPYSFSWSGVTAGSYVLTARATDNSGATTTSGSVSITVNPPPNQAPTVSLTGPANGSSYTAPASLVLTATAADADGTVSKVEFFAGATKIGESLSAPYSFSWSGVTAGSYVLTARATDNSGATTTSGSVSITVSPPANVAPTVSLTAPAGGSSYTDPATISLTASASDSDGTVSKVEFFANGSKIGESLSAPYAFSWSGVTAGSYVLTARATDNSGATTTTAGTSITVNPASGGSSINVALQANGGVATASSVYSTAYPVSAVNDGDRKGNRWANGGGWNDASASSFPDWLQINFSGSKTIDRIVLYTLADNYAAGVEPTDSTTFTLYGVQDFTVQYWNGSAWVTVPGGAVSGNNKVMRSISFPAVSTDRVRVTISNALYWYSRVVELEAWGN